MFVFFRRKEEEAALYASLKEAREAAKRIEEEKMRSQEEVTLRVNDLRVSFNVYIHSCVNTYCFVLVVFNSQIAYYSF